MPEPEGNTTYGVATILEEKYQLFSKFAESESVNIAKYLESSISGAIENLALGVFTKNPFLQANEEIDANFRNFLDIEKMAQLGVPGVPTKAALMGKSSRLKRKMGARRPSFIDSGVLQASFKSWVD